MESILKKPIRIAIATSGRFHVLDLARELHALGYDVRFYSYVPRQRAIAFGLPPECYVNLIPLLLPVLGWFVKAPKLWPGLLERWLWAALNRAVIARLQPCDVFICMSGIYLEAAKHARDKFGALVVLERGSKHILAQDEILARLPGAERPSALAIAREQAGYKLADSIMIASQHVLESFARDPDAQRKCVVNPYGVELALFPPLPARVPTREVVFVYAGMWSYRKGCDLLTLALQQTSGIRLVHVGALGDCPFPAAQPNIQHLDKVDQAALSGIYRSADAFVLASREEGLSMVQAQALASGLPVLCTADTGGQDLCHAPALADRVHVVPSDSVDALVQGLLHVASRLRAGPAYAPLTEADRQTLTWSAYGKRYAENLESLLQSALRRNSLNSSRVVQ